MRRGFRKDCRRGVSVPLVGLAVVLLLAACVRGEETGDFQLTMHGVKTWTVRYGIGDSEGLASVALGPYQLGLEQSLAVDISGTALSVLTVKAHFNDQEASSMQSLTVSLDADELQGVFGDFSLSNTPTFAAYNKQLRRVQLDYRIGSAMLSGVVAQVQGTSESKTFVGQTAHEELLFTRTQAEKPWLAAPYPENLGGLYHYRLAKQYVVDFSQVSLAFDPAEGLQSLLESYGLRYLFQTVKKTAAKDLSTGSFVVVTSSDADYLLLTSEPENLVRNRMESYIDAYNEDNGLSGDDRKEYPFNTGTDYEKTFLDKVMAFVNLVVDGASQPLWGGARQRFYRLGHTNVTEDSVVVEVSLHGGTFRATTEPDLADYRVIPYETEGIVEVRFPQSFFDDTLSEMRISFDYSVSGGVFTLGLSVVPGSERVYLNDKLLVRDTDYTIDYDVGALILLVKVGDKDTIRIDYESARGGLGSSAEYASTLYGASLKLPLSPAVTLQVSTVASVDSTTPLVEADQVHTMPNRHVVSGLVAAVRLDGFSADVELGLNHDEFPLDNNERTNLPNQVTAILPVAGYVFASSFGGVSVYANGTWGHYDTSDGLSGNRVYDMQSDGERVFFATGSGLTVLSLIGENPLAQADNWLRYSESDGLPNSAVRALLLADGTLWVGTEGGLASVPVNEINQPASWKTYTSGLFADIGEVLALAGDGQTLYLAAEQGVYRFDVATGELALVATMGTLVTEDLLFDGGTLYVACGLGVRSFKDGVGTGWVVFGQDVHTLALVDGELSYGTDDGLLRASGGASTLAGWTITALAVGEDGALWVGSKADASYQLPVWREDGGVTRFDSDETGLDGRDESRFADISAEAHTDEGLLSRVSFQRDLGAFSVSGSFESISPQFTSIGRLSREDSTGWQVEATGHPAKGLDLSVSHSYYLMDAQTSSPSATMQDKLSLQWDFGPHLGLSLASGLTNDDPLHEGFDTSQLSYTIDLSHQLFGNALSLGLHWTDTMTATTVDSGSGSDTSLAVDGRWTVSPELSIGASWKRPVDYASEGTASGEDDWTVNVDWAHLFAPLQVNVHYAGSGSRAIPDGEWLADHEVRLGLSVDRLGVGVWQLGPSLQLSGTSESGVVSVAGSGTLRGSLEELSAQAAYSVELKGLGETRQQLIDRLTVSASFAGWESLKPSLSYAESTSAVTYEDQAVTTVTRTLTGRALWTPDRQARDDLSISLRGTSSRETVSLSASARNSLSYAISDVLSARLELDGNCQRTQELIDLDASLKGAADLVLSQTWRASVSLSYAMGKTSSGTFFNSLLVELTVVAVF